MPIAKAPTKSVSAVQARTVAVHRPSVGLRLFPRPSLCVVNASARPKPRMQRGLYWVRLDRRRPYTHRSVQACKHVGDG